MAAPNIVDLNYAYAGNRICSWEAVNSTDKVLIDNPPNSNKVIKINNLSYTTEKVTLYTPFHYKRVIISVSIVRNGIQYKLISTAVVPEATTLEIIAKDVPIYLEEGDAIVVNTDSTTYSYYEFYGSFNLDYETIASSVISYSIAKPNYYSGTPLNIYLDYGLGTDQVVNATIAGNTTITKSHVGGTSMEFRALSASPAYTNTATSSVANGSHTRAYLQSGNTISISFMARAEANNANNHLRVNARIYNSGLSTQLTSDVFEFTTADGNVLTTNWERKTCVRNLTFSADGYLLIDFYRDGANTGACANLFFDDIRVEVV